MKALFPHLSVFAVNLTCCFRPSWLTHSSLLGCRRRRPPPPPPQPLPHLSSLAKAIPSPPSSYYLVASSASAAPFEAQKLNNQQI